MGANCSVEVGKFQHESLGLMEFLTSKGENGPQVQLKRKVQSRKMFQQWDLQLRMYLQEDFREVFYLPHNYAFVGEGMCGTQGVVSMDFEYYKYSLKSEITNRHHSRVSFEETELWYLLYNLLEAAFLLEPLSQRIGDIHPLNIVLNEKGRIKIIPHVVFPNAKSSYQKIVEDRTADVFLAPEEMDQNLIEQGIYPIVDAIKAQTFSIGVVLLMSACLRNSYYLYDRKVLAFNTLKKQEHFVEAQQIYSPYFCSILSDLLQQDPKKRRSSVDIFRQLNRYEDDILSLRKFDRFQTQLQRAFQKEESYEPSIADIMREQEKKNNEGSPISSILDNLHSL